MPRTNRWTQNRTADPDPAPRHALALLEHEDRALLVILDRFEGERDELAHGEAGQLLVEHLTLRQAAREQVAMALRQEPAVADLVESLSGDDEEARADLVQLDEMARGVDPTDLDRGQPFDRTVNEVAGPLRRQIRTELDEVIPQVQGRIPDDELERLLPSAKTVTSHALAHPDQGKPPRRLHRFAPFRSLRAMYQWMRRLPGGGNDLEPPWLADALRERGEPAEPDRGDPESGPAGRP
jgi:hypothetical protein